MRRNEICDKLSQSKSMCVGMDIPENAFALSAHIANHFSEELFCPIDLALAVAKILEDDDIAIDKKAVEYLPLIIDAVFEVQFAEKFRDIFSRVFGYNPKRLLRGKAYPRYASEASEWWAKEVLSPSLEGMPKAFARTRRKFSDYEVMLFKQTLAEEIIKQVENEGSCVISCEWSPDEVLAKAGGQLGIDPNFGYPPKRQMAVFEKQLRVMKNEEQQYTIIDL